MRSLRVLRAHLIPELDQSNLWGLNSTHIFEAILNTKERPIQFIYPIGS
jgi:hypothetical protein